MKKFIRRKEDFHCKQCGFFVSGTGYTNHCPNCLWSQHVDVYPGDRRAKCKGMMAPIAIEKKSSQYIVVHKCQKCAYINRNKILPQDNFDAIVNVEKNKTI